eukprot:scaffold144696_cov226-Phaeocystis_antarctica.AAC.2
MATTLRGAQACWESSSRPAPLKRVRWGGLGTSHTVLPDARNSTRRAQLTHQADSGRALRGRAGRAQPQDVLIRGLALA